MSETDTRTDQQLADDPQAFDARLAGKYAAWEKATAALQRAYGQIHDAAGDRKEYHGRDLVWRRTHAEVEGTVRQMATHGEPLPVRMGSRQTPGDLLAALRDAEAALTDAAVAVQKMEAIYRRPFNRWQRFFPCTNRDGHIHASYRNCPTVRWDTAMAWRPDLSGKTVDEAVADLGPALCSVCFPAAPVEQKSMTLGQVADERTKGERDAARAARQAAKDAKTLTLDEEFRTEGSHDLVTTVARCKELIRQAIEAEVELEWINLPERENAQGMDADTLARMRQNRADSVLAAQRDAGRASAVLQARETRHQGWGATQAEITKMQQNKYKNARKEWGLA
jgi:hypothetical protein